MAAAVLVAFMLAGCAATLPEPGRATTSSAPGPATTAAKPASSDSTGASPNAAAPRIAISGDRGTVAGPAVASVSNDPLRPIESAGVASLRVASQLAPTDLWERIRTHFDMPNLDTPQVREREQWYATRPDYINRMVERSRKYLFHVVEELELRRPRQPLGLVLVDDDLGVTVFDRLERDH